MIRTLKLAGCLFVALALHGCATYRPVPDGYTGPVANIADSGIPGDGSRSQIFGVVEIDGNPIDTSFSASGPERSLWRSTLATRFISRQVPATPMKVKLVGSHITMAPIQAIVGQIAGNFFSVSGTVDFRPAPGGNYIVKGELKKGGSSIWIEDRATGLPVTEKIVEK